MLEWVRTRESGSESESTRPESESESITPESESIRCESESIGPESESESESTGPESESESESSRSESESESASPTEVRVSPDSAWTHESNNRKVLYFNPTFKGPYADYIRIPQGLTGSSTSFDIQWKPIYFSGYKSKILTLNSL